MSWDVTAASDDLKRGLVALQAISSPHVYEDVHEILMTQMLKIVQAVRTDQDAGIHHCDQLLDQLHRLFGATRRAHVEAVSIVEEAGRDAVDYCLFLRKFDTGEHTILLPPLDSAERILYISTRMAKDASLQSVLLKAAAGRWRVIGVENLRSLPDEVWRERQLLHAPMPMVFLGVDNWKHHTEALMRDAAAVVMYLDEISESVAWELDALERNGCSGKTVILAATSVSDESFRKSGRVVWCGKGGLDVDLEVAADAARDLLASRSGGRRTEERRVARPVLPPFDFSSALPAQLRFWAARNIGGMKDLLALAFNTRWSAACSVAAAAAQSLAVHGWLAWNQPAIAMGLSVFAGIQSLPQFRELRSRHGLTREELGAANMARAREYATADECESWRAQTLAALA